MEIMLRIVLQRIHTGDACNVGGPVTTSVRTFDVDIPEVEKCLRDTDRWTDVQVIGIETLDATSKEKRDEA